MAKKEVKYNMENPFELKFVNLWLDMDEHVQIENDIQNLIGKYIARDFVCAEEEIKDSVRYLKARNILEELISDIRKRGMNGEK